MKSELPPSLIEARRQGKMTKSKLARTRETKE